MPEPADLVRRQLWIGRPSKQDLPAGGMRQATDAVDQRGLAGAVGADQADHPPHVAAAGIHRQRHMVQGCQAGERCVTSSDAQVCVIGRTRPQALGRQTAAPVAARSRPHSSGSDQAARQVDDHQQQHHAR